MTYIIALNSFNVYIIIITIIIIIIIIYLSLKKTMTFPKSPPRFGAPKQSGARQEPLRHGIFDTSTGSQSQHVGKRPMEKR